MASQSDGEKQAEAAAEQAMSGAPWHSGGDSSAMESLTQSLVDALKDATESVNNLTAVQQSQPAPATASGLEELVEGMTTGESGLGAVVSVAGGMGSDFLSGGFLLSPILSGIMSLFGAGGNSAPAPITTFALPPALNLDAAGGQATGGQVVGGDFGANGLPRAQSAASNVTVQVNAMDSRSFLDRSTDIATAVRQAILNSHSINDAISEL